LLVAAGVGQTADDRKDAVMAGPFQHLGTETMETVLERKRMLDAAWAVCLVALLATVAVPWFLSVLDIDLARVAMLVFAMALAYLLVGAVTDRFSNQFAVGIAMRVMPLVSIVLMGPLWHLAGGLANPVFLAAFVLPVILSGIMMSGWSAHVAAMLSVAVAFSVALAESADLRWYMSGGHESLYALIATLPQVGPSSSSFAELRLSPAYYFTILVTFAMTQGLAAFLTTPIASLVLRLDTRLRVSHRLLHEVQGIFHAVLSAAPEPSVVLYADSYQPVQASDSFFHRMLVKPSGIVGKSIFQIVHFENPGRVQTAFQSPSGEIPFCAYRVGTETRIANVSFHRTDHAGMAYLYVGWQELTETYYLHAAFDALEEPLLVINADKDLQYANRVAGDLFGPTHFGMSADAVPGLPAIIAESRSRKPTDDVIRRTIAGRPYTIQSLTATLPEESGVCTILWFHCVEREEALFEQATRDPLTGIYNRRYFDDALAMHVERRKRGHALSLAYFDLDNFKTINDKFGHAGGDAALQGFAQAMRSQLREIDVFARRGGDEFAVMFIDCGTDVAAAAIARVHTLITTDGCHYDGHRLPLGFSAGLAECRTTDTVEEFLERADRAVYIAKGEGKGRCVVEK
jgi:diguanylate cyclase (GGDEF)-like protein